jgi:hypothetical protein
MAADRGIDLSNGNEKKGNHSSTLSLLYFSEGSWDSRIQTSGPLGSAEPQKRLPFGRRSTEL